jgi:Domain of unknown function (DUF4386)
MSSLRRTALVAGVFYLITFVSIPTLFLYGPVKEIDYISSSGSDTGVLVGCFLEILVAIAGIGTAITLFPVVKRQNEGMALGFVASRTLEAAMIFTGVASLLSLVTLRQDLGSAAGADAASMVSLGASHVATYNWAFTLGQSLMPGMNAILLGTLLYRSRLVPRILPTLGLVGAPLHITAVVLTLFGAIDRVGTVAGIAVLPIATWELSLGIYLVVKGFKPSPITRAMAPPLPAQAAPATLHREDIRP